MSKIPNTEFIDCYVFVKFCLEVITHSENIQLAKNKINEKVIEDFLIDRPHLEKEFGPKKEEMATLDEKIEYEKDQ